MIRRVAAAGGFAAVLRKGDPDAGTLLLVLLENGGKARLFERMPQPDGNRAWHCAKQQVDENASDFTEYLARRGEQDPDSWLIELDIAQAERFIG